MVIDIPSSSNSGFSVGNQSTAPVIYYNSNTGRLRLDSIERLGMGNDANGNKLRGISVVCKIKANNSHYWLWFRRGVLVHAWNERREPTGYTPLIQSAFNVFVYNWEI